MYRFFRKEPPMSAAFQRTNYGGRRPASRVLHRATNDLLVALDLLMPSYWHYNCRVDGIERTLIDLPQPSIEHRKGTAIECYYVTSHVFEWLRTYAVNASAEDRCGIKAYKLSGVAFKYWHNFLSAHDNMHVADTLAIRPGIYRHFKKEKDGEKMLYCVHGVSGSTESAELVVCYQSLYGEKAFAMAHRPRDMFAEIIYRPECTYVGPRFALIKEFDRPRYIWSKEELAATLA